jgi:hypothetical protein
MRNPQLLNHLTCAERNTADAGVLLARLAVSDVRTGSPDTDAQQGRDIDVVIELLQRALQAVQLAASEQDTL